VLICALIHISIEGLEKNYSGAVAHLNNAFQLMRASSKPHAIGAFNSKDVIDSDLSHCFVYLDVHLSIFEGMREPVLLERANKLPLPGRFQSLTQAKSVLDNLTLALYRFARCTAEEYKHRKLQEIPIEAFGEIALIKAKFDSWKDRFEKFLHRSTSKFSRNENSLIDLLIINHRVHCIEASTCAEPDQTIFDRFDSEFDEIVTLAANIIRARRSTEAVEFTLDIGIIMPLYVTALKCRVWWIRQRAVSLLKSISFQEGAWNAAIQVAMAQVAIEREYAFNDANTVEARPAEFARVHTVGAEEVDHVNRIIKVTLTQKLNGLDGPWHIHTGWGSW
jgi:hypothetical protein